MQGLLWSEKSTDPSSKTFFLLLPMATSFSNIHQSDINITTLIVESQSTKVYIDSPRKLVAGRKSSDFDANCGEFNLDDVLIFERNLSAQEVTMLWESFKT